MARQITVELIPDGGVVGAGKRILNAVTVGINQSIQDDAVHVLVGGGTSTAKIVAFSDVASKVAVTVEGAEVT